MAWLIYGANGYTGELVARQPQPRLPRPILAGRSADAVRPLAEELGCEWRAFPLEVPEAVAAGLAGASVVLHCAGPFSRTSRAMADACLQTRTHYLDITGEIPVFEALAARDAEAKAARVMLLPGAGFDVVPSDCLAAHLKRRLPSADRLTLGLFSTGGVSRGTATTVIENLGRGGLVRQAGALTAVPTAWRMRQIDFGRGPRASVTIPWGDVSTAFHSTGIPNIEVYLAASGSVRLALRLARLLRGLLASRGVRSWLERWIRSRAPGPTPERRARSRSVIWGEVRDAQGGRAEARLRTPDGYTLTVLTALALVERALAGNAPPGFQTPSRAYGADFILELPGVEREDL